MLKVGFCGVGNMSGSILKAALSSETLSPAQVIAYNPTRDKLNAFDGVSIADSNSDVCSNCDVVFLGFKPQKLFDFAAEIKGALNNKCVVSMLAGVSVRKLQELLGNVTVIRVMPNTPITVGVGCTAIARNNAPKEVQDLIYDIFKSSGSIVDVNEEDINKTIPLSSSSPAFFFRFVRAMCDAGVNSGIDYDTAKQLVISTLHGVAHMMSEGDKTPDELIAQVTSPGGTTLAGLTAFDDFEFEKMINLVFERTIKRAEELGK